MSSSQAERSRGMRDQFARFAATATLCALLAGCITAGQVANESASGPTSATSPESQRMIQLAGDVEARGEYETAAALYARAAATSGDATEAQLRRGNAHLKSGNYPGAREAFAKVLQTNPKDPEALLGLGTAQLKSNDV